MTDAAPIATIVDYGSLIEALRTAAARRNIAIASEETAELAGLAHGYIARLLSPGSPRYAIGATALGPVLGVLGVLGVMLVMVDDPRTLAMTKGRLAERDCRYVRVKRRDASHPLTKRQFMKEIGSIGNAARMKKTSPAQRSRAAKKAALTRWRKHRAAAKAQAQAQAATTPQPAE